jgi:hypothetical protein
MAAVSEVEKIAVARDCEWFGVVRRQQDCSPALRGSTPCPDIAVY